LMDGAAVVVTERVVRKAKIREVRKEFCIGDAP